MCAGRPIQCVDKNYESVDLGSNHSEHSDRSACYLDEDNEWINEPVHFDNVIQAYVSLLEVATFKGWIALIQGAADSTVSRSVYFIQTQFEFSSLILTTNNFATVVSITPFCLPIFHFRVVLIVCLYECERANE